MPRRGPPEPLCPPPIRRAVIRPPLFRPPVLDLPSASALTGFPFHKSERSTSTSWRWEGVIGLYDFSAIRQTPVVTSMDWPSSSETIAFL